MVGLDYKRRETCQVASRKGCELLCINRVQFDGLLKRNILSDQFKRSLREIIHQTKVARKKQLPRPDMVILKNINKEIIDLENKVLLDYEVGRDVKRQTSNEQRLERRKQMQLKVKHLATAKHILSEIHLFKHIDKKDIKIAVKHFTLPIISDTVIYEEGDISDKFYIILEGSVGVYRGRISDEAHCKIRVLESAKNLIEQKKHKRWGHQNEQIQPYFGETALLKMQKGLARRTATCVAIEDSLLIYITREQYHHLRNKRFDTEVDINLEKLRDSNLLINAQNYDDNLGDDATKSVAKMLIVMKL